MGLDCGGDYLHSVDAQEACDDPACDMFFKENCAGSPSWAQNFLDQSGSQVNLHLGVTARGDGIHLALGQPLNEDLAPRAQRIVIQPQAIPHQVEDQGILEEQYL